MDEKRWPTALPYEPPAPDSATRAFTQLQGELALLRRAIEHLATEKTEIEVPDYSNTLAKIAKSVIAIEGARALQMTPEDFQARFEAAAQSARESDRITIKEMKELNRQSNAAMSKATGTLRAKEEQRNHLLYAIGIAILAISLLWLIYPGWAASMGPQSWHWPERVARRTMGEPTLWDAGIRLMRAGNPGGWQAIVDAADMRQDNRDTIAACEQQAAKAKEPVRCTIRIRNRHP